MDGSSAAAVSAVEGTLPTDTWEVNGESLFVPLLLPNNGDARVLIEQSGI
jgi:hypothetical protein